VRFGGGIDTSVRFPGLAGLAFYAMRVSVSRSRSRTTMRNLKQSSKTSTLRLSMN
jgi:hypothetical protein